MSGLRRARSVPLLACAVLSLSVLVAIACGDDDEKAATTGTPAGGSPANLSGKTVDALGIWGEEEQADFQAMIQPWKTDTGAEVKFTGTRDVNSILTTRVAGGDPPDVALPASLGIFHDLARDGKLTPLSDCPGLEEKVKAEYSKEIVDLGTVDGKLYGVFMKAGNKGTIWYNPKFFEANGYKPLAADATFQDLLDLTKQIADDKDAGKHDVFPWSDAEEAGGGSGFPGSDWIQQIVLAESGVDVYDQWVAHEIPYNDPKIKQAWEMFGQILLEPRYVLGGAQRALATKFSEGAIPLFTQPPQAAMHYLGSFNSNFITDPTLGFPQGLNAGTDFDFFPFDLAAYPTDLDRRIAQRLTDPDTVFRFDADDAMPSGVGGDNGAVFTGVLSYLSGGDLDEILQGVENAFPKTSP